MTDAHRLQDVLTDFATLDGDPELHLDAFILRFPEFEDELLELAEELSMDAGDVSECAPVDARQAADARRSFAEIERGIAGRLHPTGDLVDPFSGRVLKLVAQRFGCTVLLLARLRDRVIRSEELSVGFIAALAQALSASAEDVAAYLAVPSRIPAGASFKSDLKPEAAGKQGLDEALRASGLSEEQRRRLSSL